MRRQAVRTVGAWQCFYFPSTSHSSATAFPRSPVKRYNFTVGSCFWLQDLHFCLQGLPSHLQALNFHPPAFASTSKLSILTSVLSIFIPSSQISPLSSPFSSQALNSHLSPLHFHPKFSISTNNLSIFIPMFVCKPICSPRSLFPLLSSVLISVPSSLFLLLVSSFPPVSSLLLSPSFL